MRIPLPVRGRAGATFVLAAATLAAALLSAGCASTRSTTQSAVAADSATPPKPALIPGYNEFYRQLRYNAVDQLVFCDPTVTPRTDPVAIGVARDLSGRPVKVTRFFFGNPDSRQEWTSMEITYTFYSSSGTTRERRTWHGPDGAPVNVRGAWGLDLLSRNAQPTMRRLIDRDGNPLQDVKLVVRSLYHEDGPNSYVQEWFYGNGKQYYGIATDEPEHPFAPMPAGAYFRRFTVNASGELVREEVWGIEKQAMPYPGGEMGRLYDLGACGRVQQLVYVGEDGRPRPNSDGIASESFVYDDFGRLVRWEAFGPSGTPRQRASDGAAAVVYHYRPFDGILVSTERFDEKGTRIEKVTE